MRGGKGGGAGWEMGMRVEKGGLDGRESWEYGGLWGFVGLVR